MSLKKWWSTIEKSLPMRNKKMKISKEGIALIKKFEGLELKAYQDSVGIWTIGWGHTKEVFEGMEISKEEAEAFLEIELEEFESYVEDLVDVELEQCQFDALVCWTYNLGPTNLAKLYNA